MSRPESITISLHKDPAMFREAVNFTAAETTFLPRLIEKDYFCTVLLSHLLSSDSALVFKGGTCLAKVYAGFYRLSEDLDFVIPMPVDASRSARRTAVTGLKAAITKLPQMLGAFQVIEPLAGANNSTQYAAVVCYLSLISRQQEIIKIEVGLREPLLTPRFKGEARTLLLDPISGKPMAPVFPVSCLSWSETMAEKLRAALTRREAAIRDFFDIDYAVRRLDLHPRDTALVELVRQKLAVPGNDPIDVSETRLAVLRQQLDPRLKSVLRRKDFAEFDLERAFRIVTDLAAMIG